MGEGRLGARPPGCWDPEPGRALPPSLGGKGKDLYSPAFQGSSPPLDGAPRLCPHSWLPKGINKELEAFPCALVIHGAVSAGRSSILKMEGKSLLPRTALGLLRNYFSRWLLH